ncbi:uncharacterized protein K489DRAFT_404762 [Dissoconium aciculare CBS 342.82]|jgi:hypothetical protein|uniref:Uncharacterized protein n=1 Tax=Dissoconium aciculare CBS 342.82 TaxID=1314786 RepID=A0A6J3LSM7_9PEZI|nr:uncharacterized protein K489DRAFT_404762 [Dissoconium aciculare CBS 342.82]KAF1818633.1 hypothetical protein K489DRAFT_404762 [Dissoconium aciculare CBS 342.82]
MSEGYKRPFAETVAGKILDQKLKDVRKALEADLRDLCQELALAEQNCRCILQTSDFVILNYIADWDIQCAADTKLIESLRQRQIELEARSEKARLKQERLNATHEERLQRGMEILREKVRAHGAPIVNYRRRIFLHWRRFNCLKSTLKFGE